MPKVIVWKRYSYTQSTPSSLWKVRHNLNVIHPVVDVWIKENDTYINSDAAVVEYKNKNEVHITFTNNTSPIGKVLVT